MSLGSSIIDTMPSTVSIRRGVTAVIPVWGDYVTQYLPIALASVERQTGVDLDVIIVDNANSAPIDSPDNATVVRSNEVLTLGEARNFGLEQVKTEYVLFLDADDELCPNILRTMTRVLDEDPDLVAVAPRIVDRKTGSQYVWPRRWSYWLQERHPKLFRAAECYRPCFPVNASLIRTSVAKSTPGYGSSPHSAEDWLFGVSLALRGPIALVNEYGLIYESRPGGVWSRQTRWRQHARHRTEVRRRLREDPATPLALRFALPLLAVAHELDALRKLFS